MICEICNFYEEKKDGFCAYCYRKIMKKTKTIGNLTDEQIMKIHNLRKKFYVGKYGNLDFFPQDRITEEAKRILYLEKLEKKWSNVLEIRY
jgi:hypothetical protein